jgi:hypothetical protein
MIVDLFGSTEHSGVAWSLSRCPRFFSYHHPPGGGVRTLRNAAKPVKGQVDFRNAHLSRVGKTDARTRGFASAKIHRRRGLGWNGNCPRRVRFLEHARGED